MDSPDLTPQEGLVQLNADSFAPDICKRHQKPVRREMNEDHPGDSAHDRASHELQGQEPFELRVLERASGGGE